MDTPVFQHLPNILQLANSDPIVRIVASPGSGTAIGIPAGFSLTTAGQPVVVVAPTDTAAKLWAIQFNGLPINFPAGYITINDNQTNDSTKIFYVTREYLTFQMIRDFKTKSCDIWDKSLYIFECIEYSTVELQVLIGLWKLCASRNVAVPRLILVASNVNSLNIPIIADVYTDKSPYNISEQNLDLQISYLHKGFPLWNDKVYDEIAKAAISYNSSQSVGDFMIFLPSDAEVGLVANKLRGIKNASIITVTNRSKEEPINKLLEKHNRRKIVLVTSQTECAVSLPNVSVVIDSLRYLKSFTSPADSIQLEVAFASKSIIADRKRRTSRTIKGIYLPMGSQTDVSKLSDDSGYPDYGNQPIHRMMFQLLNAGIEPNQIFPYPSGAVDLLKIKASNLNLISNDNLTDSGKFATNFTVNMKLSLALYDWLQAGFPAFPMLLVIAIIDQYGNGYFKIPFKNREESDIDYKSRINKHKLLKYKKFKGSSDLETAMNVLLDLFASTNCLSGGKNAIVKWSKKNSIDTYRVSKTLTLIDQLITILQGLNVTVKVGPFDVKNAVKELQIVLGKTYNDRIMVKSRNLYQDITTNTLYSLNTRNSYSTMLVDSPCHVIGLLTSSYTISNGQTRRSIDLSFDLPSDLDNCPIKIPVGLTSVALTDKTKSPSNYHRDLVKWCKTFNVTSLNLSPSDLAIWNENVHIRQVFYNRAKFPNDGWTYAAAGRELHVSERYLRLSGSNPTPTREYQNKQVGEIRTVDYWGQRKSAIMAIEFLTYYGTKATTVVYAGATGKYFNYLADLFPKHTFHIYTTLKISAKHDRIVLHSKNFNDQIAQSYDGKDILFMSDIRNVSVDNKGKQMDMDTEKSVKSDMEKQKLWVNIMKPKSSWLKFRLPYTSGTTEYFQGNLWIQPWGPSASTETRLIFDGVPVMTNYDNDTMSNMMYWHNTVQRTFHYDQDVTGDGLDNCYDCSSEVMILKTYAKTYHAVTDNEQLKTITAQISKHISNVISKKRTLDMKCK